jgi:hypothetical protein
MTISDRLLVALVGLLFVSILFLVLASEPVQ